MSPRVVPKRPLDPPDVVAAERAASDAASRVSSTSGSLSPYSLQYAPTKRWNWRGESYDEVAPPEGVRIPSYFGDLLLEAQANARAAVALESPVLQGRDQGDPSHPEADSELAAARERLDTVRQFSRSELRDITASATNFVPAAGIPGYVASSFAIAARGKATLANRLQRRPLLNMLKLQVPRLSGGAALAVQTSESAAVQETDPTSVLAESPVASIFGQVDISRQLLDFSSPGMDEVLAADLGADYATKLETQVISGSGSAGQTLGLRNVPAQLRS